MACHLVITDVSIVTANLLVASGAECVRASASQDDGAYRNVVAGPLKCVGQFKECLRTESVAALGAIDCDLRDAVSDVVEDVFVLPNTVPRR